MKTRSTLAFAKRLLPAAALALAGILAAQIPASANGTPTLSPSVSSLGNFTAAPGNASAAKSFTINGMGHGTPITARGDAACGTPMPHMLETGISSTRHIAAFWGIAPAVAPATARAPLLPTAMAQMPAGGVADVINVALRQAGLMR
jgi:hypothetical protein